MPLPSRLLLPLLLPLAAAQTAVAQGSGLFDETVLRDIEIVFKQTSWQQLLLQNRCQQVQTNNIRHGDEKYHRVGKIQHGPQLHGATQYAKDAEQGLEHSLFALTLPQ